MANLSTTKSLLLSLLLVLGCAGGPDELHLGYGHTFAGDSRLGADHRSLGIDNEDLDTVTVGLSWRLRPQRVVVENPVALPVRRSLEPVQASKPASEASEGPIEEYHEESPPPQKPEPVEDAVHDEREGEPSRAELDAMTHAAGHIDALGLASKIILGVLALVAMVVYRRQIGGVLGRITGLGRLRNGGGPKKG